eukprot:98033_1
MSGTDKFTDVVQIKISKCQKKYTTYKQGPEDKLKIATPIERELSAIYASYPGFVSETETTTTPEILSNLHNDIDTKEPIELGLGTSDDYINMKFTQIMNQLNIPQRIRPKMLKLDKAQKIKMNQQYNRKQNLKSIPNVTNVKHVATNMKPVEKNINAATEAKTEMETLQITNSNSEIPTRKRKLSQRISHKMATYLNKVSKLRRHSKMDKELMNNKNDFRTVFVDIKQFYKIW